MTAGCSKYDKANYAPGWKKAQKASHKISQKVEKLHSTHIRGEPGAVDGMLRE